MCRLLLVKSDREFETAPYLEAFAERCRTSSEYQGDGWGALLGENGERRLVKHPTPIWEHDLGGFGRTRFLLAHARSAFRDGEVHTSYNMPFVDERLAFAFNGELHGVRLKADGGTGAEKIFNLVRRLDHGDPGAALERAVEVLCRRSAHIRALNMILADGERAWVCSLFSEQPDYFTMHLSRSGGRLAVCSEPLAGAGDWRPLPNRTLERVA